MRRSSSLSIPPEAKSETSESNSRKQSYARKQSTVTPEFQMSMLKVKCKDSKMEYVGRNRMIRVSIP